MIILHPTAGTNEFDAVVNLPEAWQELLQQLTDFMLFSPDRQGGRENWSALEELKAWRRDRRDIRYYNPLAMKAPANSEAKNIHWAALPTSFDQDPRFGGDRKKILAFLDEPQSEPGNPSKSRQQDEYCEWVVQRSGNNIKRVIFTCEPALFYDFLFDPKGLIQSINPLAPDPQVDRDASRNLLVDIYRQRTQDTTIQLSQLLDTQGNYSHFNPINRDFAVHLQQRNNTLGAEINIAVRASLLRAQGGGGPIKQDAGDLIRCARYGEEARQSDPSIGSAVNRFARENRFLTLADPIGLYITGLDTEGWTAPNNANPREFWTVLNGHEDQDPDKTMIVRAEYAVPAGRGFTVSDIKIEGAAVAFGGHIADRIGMRLAALVGPAAGLAAPRPIGCVREVIPAPGPAPAFAAAVAGTHQHVTMWRRGNP